MRRRAFVAGMAATMAAPLRVEAQGFAKLRRLGILAEGSPVSELLGAAPKAPAIRQLLTRLHELGYRHGDNLITDARSAEGKLDRLPALADELVRSAPDAMVVTSNRGALAAREATHTVPIVMAGISDPIGFGLVAHLARPGGNITGMSLDTGPEFSAKRLELLKDVVPTLRRVAYFVPTLVWFERPGGKAVQQAAAVLGVTLAPIVVTTPGELENSAMIIQKHRPDALLVEAYIFAWVERRAIIEFALRQRLPAMFGNRGIVEAGGLLSHSADFNTVYRRAADYVDSIFKGAKPGDLPIEQPTKFEIVVNLKTARALNLTIPPSLLLRADQVID